MKTWFLNALFSFIYFYYFNKRNTYHSFIVYVILGNLAVRHFSNLQLYRERVCKYTHTWFFNDKKGITRRNFKRKTYQPLEELNLMNNFLFHTIVTQGEDVSELVKLEGTDMADAEVIPDIYDIEPNNTYEKATLPKRMRYYHGLIDTKHLNIGLDYDRLPRVVIIVILPYDPFGLNRMLYTIKNQCVEVPNLPYEDGAVKIFLYTKGTEGNPSQSLLDMLKYLEETSEKNIVNEDINQIHKFVEKAKHRKEVGVQYMRLCEENIQMKKAAHEAGLAEGRETGLLEARSEGMKILIVTYKKLSQSKEAAIEALMDAYKMKQSEAVELVTKYWE